MINESNQLSEREQEILRLVATGLSNQQIANALGISVNTVKVHLRNVFGKIGVASRTEATMFAVRSGIVAVETNARGEPIPDALPPDVDVAKIEPAIPDTPWPVTDAPTTQGGEPSSFAEPPVAPIARASTIPPVEAPTDAALQSDATTPSTVPRSSSSPSRSWLRPMQLFVALITIGAIALLGAQFLRARQVDNAQLASSEAARSRWKGLPAIKTPRAAFGIANIGDQVFVIGGENKSGVLGLVERYDVRFTTWAELTSKPTPVTDVHAAMLGGKIYVPGGRTSSDPKAATKVFERYDPRTDQWERLPDLPAPRSAYALAALEGKIYLFGGWDGSSYRNEVFMYDPDRQAWSTRTPMPTARAYADAAVVQDSIFVLGGENQTGTLRSNESYTPAQEGAQPWTPKTPLPQPRSRFGAAVALRTIHVVGGNSAAGPVKYNVGTDNWESFEASPQPIGSQAGVIQKEETMIVLGGKLPNQEYDAAMQTYQSLFTISIPSTINNK